MSETTIASCFKIKYNEEEKKFLELFEKAMTIGFELDEKNDEKIKSLIDDKKKYSDTVLEMQDEIEYDVISFCLHHEIRNEANKEKVVEFLQQIFESRQFEKRGFKNHRFYSILTDCINWCQFELFDKMVDIAVKNTSNSKLKFLFNSICEVDRFDDERMNFVLERLPNGKELVCYSMHEFLVNLVEDQEFSFIEKILEKGFPIDASFESECERLLSNMISIKPDDPKNIEESNNFFKKLLELGANPNFSNGDIIPPIFLCYRAKNFIDAEALILHPDFDFFVNYNGYSIYELCENKHTRNLIAKRGLKKGFVPAVSEEFMKRFIITGELSRILHSPFLKRLIILRPVDSVQTTE